MLGWIVLAGCTVPVTPCDADVDCASAFGAGWTCAASGYCRAPAPPTVPDPDTDDTDDTDVPVPPDTDTPVLPAVLIINEVLYDPSNGGSDPVTGRFPGDANNDGVYVHDFDEFVEFVNISGEIADVSGYALWDVEAWDLGQPSHVVPEGTELLPGQAFVVFGGGTPVGDFGGAVVQAASLKPMNLNNANDILRVTNADDVVIATFDVTPRSDNPNEAYTRNPDITGLFEQHSATGPLMFSPGTKVDGTPFR